MSSLNPRKNQWRFTFEALAHVPTLRLYLFKPGVNPSVDCIDLGADLQLARSLLVVSWIGSEKSERVSVWAPVPMVLIDPGSGVEIMARDDHIEIKLRLVLPVDHPMVGSLRGVIGADVDLDRFRPLELDSDLKNLSSRDVHLFCRACLTRLTRQPLRRFLEMPSVNWRDVADNWFGACCCSFGGISEKLVLQYIKTYDCAEGSCLLDSAAVIICKDDLEGFSFHPALDGMSRCWSKAGTEINSDLIDAVKESCPKESEEVPCACASTCIDDKVGRNVSDPELADCSGSARGHDSVLLESSQLAQLGLNEAQSSVTIDSQMMKSSTKVREPISPLAGELSSDDHCHCSHDDAKNAVDLSSLSLTKQVLEGEPDRIQRWLQDCSLGSGFMNRTSNLSNDIEWVEFRCKNCSSILGAYPSYENRNEPVDGGIRLFKCYISTCIPASGQTDIFRKYTLEKVFSSLLLENANDELSYRIILRDLRTKSATLQIVLLNSESWCSTGYCLENATTETLQEADLQPAVKVLFADCSSATEASSRIIKDWSSKTHTEDVYMMTHQIEELKKCLKSAADKLPHSCSYMQGMSLSSMER